MVFRQQRNQIGNLKRINIDYSLINSEQYSRCLHVRKITNSPCLRTRDEYQVIMCALLFWRASAAALCTHWLMCLK